MAYEDSYTEITTESLWVFCRPLPAVLLIAAAVGLILGMRSLSKRGKVMKPSLPA